jgi:hypothetical protein
LTFSGLHCVISQKIELFITTAVIISNPIRNYKENDWLYEWLEGEQQGVTGFKNYNITVEKAWNLIMSYITWVCLLVLITDFIMGFWIQL